jgi:hypothetical protein
LLWERYCDAEKNGLDRARFSDRFYHLSRQDMLVTYTSLYAHLIDQLMWGLLSPNEALLAAGSLLNLMNMPLFENQTEPSDAMACVHLMLGALIHGLVRMVIMLDVGSFTNDTVDTNDTNDTIEPKIEPKSTMNEGDRQTDDTL